MPTRLLESSTVTNNQRARKIGGLVQNSPFGLPPTILRSVGKQSASPITPAIATGRLVAANNC
jgi:hypothetical protein